MEVKGITIHNTNNEYSAIENYELMKKLNKEGNQVSVHYFVDSKDTVLATDLSFPTWHTGKGFDVGNMNTISIEICSKGNDEEYERAEENALFLIRQLMIKFNLSSKDIYFHRDFDVSFYCPHRILDKYTKEEWIKKNDLDTYSEYLSQENERIEKMKRRL